MFSSHFAYSFCFKIPLGTEGTVTVVVLDRDPLLHWWPILQSECLLQLHLARQGDVDLLLHPVNDSLVDYGPIPWDLWAFRVCFNC